MDDDKSIIEKITGTLIAAAESIADPTAGTPMAMPLSETGATLIRKKPVHVKDVAKRTKKTRAVKATPKKSKLSAGLKAVGKNKKKAVKEPSQKKKSKR